MMKTIESALGGIRAVTTVFLVLACMAMISCGQQQDPNDFTAEEIALIRAADGSSAGAGKDFRGRGTDFRERGTDGSATPKGTMRVLTIADRADSLLLRDTCRNLSAKALLSEEYSSLCSLMVATVTHPSQDGVGIAGPQVGLRRRVVAVQRFDKEGEPFEVYPDIRIVWASDSLAYGPEGCLSVPDRRGEVLRSQEIVIEYADVERLSGAGCSGCAGCAGCAGCDDDSRDERARDGVSRARVSRDGLTGDGGIPMRQDTIKGFTAVIFQHEIDHLDGILYIDRL